MENELNGYENEINPDYGISDEEREDLEDERDELLNRLFEIQKILGPMPPAERMRRYRRRKKECCDGTD